MRVFNEESKDSQVYNHIDLILRIVVFWNFPFLIFFKVPESLQSQRRLKIATYLDAHIVLDLHQHSFIKYLMAKGLASVVILLRIYSFLHALINLSIKLIGFLTF